MQKPVRLLILARSNQPAAVRFLERYPDSLTERVEMDNTALHLGCAMGHLETVTFLLDRGSPLESLNCVGQTPLALACEAGHRDVATLLLRRGARWDVADRLQRAPLHRAAMCASASLVRVLLSEGAFVDPVDHIDFTPLFHALYVTPRHMAAQMRAWSERQREGTTLPPVEPLDYAREERRRCAVTELLLDAGASLQHVGSCGQTPLHRAAEVAHLCPGLYRLLLERGADPNCLDANGESPAARLRDVAPA